LKNHRIYIYSRASEILWVFSLTRHENSNVKKWKICRFSSAMVWHLRETDVLFITWKKTLNYSQSNKYNSYISHNNDVFFVISFIYLYWNSRLPSERIARRKQEKEKDYSESKDTYDSYSHPKQTNFWKNAFKRSNENRDCESLTLIKKTQETRFLRKIFTLTACKRRKIPVFER
jgi:hypothetical protein